MKRALSWRSAYRYDQKLARRAVTFFENQLQHIDGEHAGDKFTLMPWQRRLVRRIFGWVKKSDSTRKHRRVFLFVPKKNGKTSLAAGLALYGFLADREPGAHIVCAAADTEQAEIVFKFAKENVLRNPKLREIVTKTFRRSMSVHPTASSFKVLSSTAETKHGPNLHYVLIDEVHAQKDGELIDTLSAGTVSRRQPLIIEMTTAGHDQNTVCGEHYLYAKKVMEGIVDDPTLLPAIFEAEEDDDWRDPKTWRKANPNFGITVKEDYFISECKKAQEISTEENKFKRLHLNIWTRSENRWLDMDKWKKCNQRFTLEELKKFPCYGGLDLSQREDVTALVLAFQMPNDRVATLSRFWVPEATALDRQRKGKAPYHDWIKKGFMFGTPGNVIDKKFIRKAIQDLNKEFDIREIGFDPYDATQLTQELSDDDGIVMVPFRQGYLSMSSPCKELGTLITSEKLCHGDNEVMNWMAANASVVSDPAGNIKVVKPAAKSALKVDGIVAMVMAIGRLMVDDKNRKSVYDNRGVLSL